MLAGLAVLAIAHFPLAIAAAPSATVATIESTRVADLVLLRGGFDAGLRAGMVCRISRGTTDIAEVLVVELRPACSAALILTLVPKQSIRPGDTASVKVLKS
ncbi:MAG: hypothetical protein Q7S40_26200 [Opitutaceae bacterium]|nr:hypothetical protein [Opitutaceae bacterium]